MPSGCAKQGLIQIQQPRGPVPGRNHPSQPEGTAWDCTKSLPPHPQMAHTGIFLILGAQPSLSRSLRSRCVRASPQAGPFCSPSWSEPLPWCPLRPCPFPVLLLPLSTPGAAFQQGQAALPSSSFCPVPLLYLLLPPSVLTASHPAVLRAAPAIASFLPTPTCGQSLSNPSLGV